MLQSIGGILGQVNTFVNLDPDFGKVVPPVESIFLVKVKSKDRGEYTFILLTPLISNEEDLENAIQSACGQLLEDGDTVDVTDYEHEDFDLVTKSTLIACFIPHDPEFYSWLFPPMWERN